MPTSFFVYLLGTFGFMVSMITANHTLDPFDYVYSNWVDQLLLAYFGMTLLFVCWWGVMMRLEVTAICFGLQPFIGLAIGAMTTVPDLYSSEMPAESPLTDAIVVVFLMAAIFLLAHWFGIVIRLIAEFIVAMGRRYSST